MVCIALPFFGGFNKMAEIDGGYVLAPQRRSRFHAPA